MNKESKHGEDIMELTTSLLASANPLDAIETALPSWYGSPPIFPLICKFPLLRDAKNNEEISFNDKSSIDPSELT